QVSTDGRTFTFTLAPGVYLDEQHTYKVQVTTDVTDSNSYAGRPHVRLANAYTSPIGFFTEKALAVVPASTTPSGTGVALNSNVTVTFNKAALPSSITVDSSNTCAGSLQLVDSAGGCVQMKALSLTASPDNKSFTVTPNAVLAGGHDYSIVVTADAKDAA